MASRRFLMAGSARIRTVSAWILSIMGLGVPAGTIRPNPVAISKPARPDSSMVGTSGKALDRVPVATAERKSVEQGTSVSIREALGGHRNIKKKKHLKTK